MKTFSAKPSQVNHEWLVIDAANIPLGRLAAIIATHLKGKHKPEYTPHVDTGDYVIVINAEKVAITGNKFKDKLYQHHTGYIGGLKTIPFNKMLAEHPERIVEKAVKGMIPRNPLGRQMVKKLKVYVGSEHPHSAQQPRTIEHKNLQRFQTEKA